VSAPRPPRRRRLLQALAGPAVLPGAPWAAPAPAPDRPEPLPVAAFAAPPQVQALTLSPDGRQLAGLMNTGGHTLLFSRDLAAGAAPRALLRSDNQAFRFHWLHWAKPRHLVVSLAYPERRGFIGATATRLVVVDPASGALRPLVEHLSVKGRAAGVLRQDGVVDWMPDDPRHILLQLPDTSAGRPAVWRVDLDSSERTLVAPPERLLSAWMSDAQHRVRLGLGLHDDQVLVQLREPDGRWRTLWRYAPGDIAAVRPLGFDRDPERLWVLADHQGRQALFTVDLGSPALARTLVLASDEADIDGVLQRDPATGAVLGLLTDDGDAPDGDDPTRTRAAWFDPALRRLARAVDQALPAHRNRLLQFSHDGARCLVYSSGNGVPGSYWLAERDPQAPEAPAQLRLLAPTRPQLPPERLAGKAAARIRARDGTPLTVFLTRPPGPGPQPGRAPGPLVLLPHGGPGAADDDDFDLLAELLASRGWSVLQVNFRGSAGRGHAFRAAGHQRWGLAMQDDLEDALAWALRSGAFDAARVAIAGASYGGYAALMGAVKTPQAFRCVVAVNAVSDLVALWLHAADHPGGVAAMRLQLGELWGDRARLTATSPARQAARITAPVLLVHGSADRVVPVDQGRAMAAALRAADRPHQWLEIPGGHHALDRAADRLAWFSAMVDFLASHLDTPPGG